MSTPTTKPRAAVCNRMPDGGDHVPSAFLAMRMPDPPDPDIHKPDRMHEKMARPTASCIMRGGIFLRFLLGPAGEVEAGAEAGAGVVGFAGTESRLSRSKKPSAESTSC